MAKVLRLPVGQLATNCYLVIAGKEALIIDPGDDADYIQRILNDEEVSLSKIIATHAHYDHILAVTELKLAYKVPFMMHQKDEFLLKEMARSAKYFSNIQTDAAPKVNEYLKDGMYIKIGHRSGRVFSEPRGSLNQRSGLEGNCKLKIIHTPGHTPGSISLYDKKNKALFVGDLIFAQGGVGRTDFRYSSIQNLTKSIESVLKLPDNTIVYSGHGDETTIKEYKEYLIS